VIAGVPHVLPIVGTFLLEIAEWCEADGHPPLNSLAVNDTSTPGDGYDEAGGFKIINWPSDVEKVYPLDHADCVELPSPCSFQCGGCGACGIRKPRLVLPSVTARRNILGCSQGSGSTCGIGLSRALL
jgi:hypothetical protein